MKKLNTKAGFTLAELLIVVAIIAVLVAISIPVFSAQLEKSREATDAANIRAAYAEIMVKAIDNPSAAASDTNGLKKSVSLKQQDTDWQNADLLAGLKGLFSGDAGAENQLKTVSSTKKTANLEWKPSATSEGTTTEGHVEITVS